MSAAGFPRVPGYRIDGKLGEGGMAEVFRATQLSLDRSVAIKVVHFGGPQRDKLAMRFEHEARTIARLEHPNIVGIFEVGRLGHDAMFYVMPLMPHGDLSARIGQLSDADIRNVVRKVAAALDFAHAQGVIHRDIKPANVLFDRDQQPRLADFGISRSPEGQGVTNEGDALGSVSYMSPEQSRGHTVDARSDLYSLGILIFELLTGDVPYREADAVATALAHHQAPIPRLPKPRASWQKLIDRALAKAPGDRFQSGAELVAMLDGLSPGDVGTPGQPSRRANLALPVLAGILAISGLLLAAKMLWPKPADPVTTTPLTKSEALPPVFQLALDREQWFAPEAGSAAAWLSGALNESRRPANLQAAQVFVNLVSKDALTALAAQRDSQALPLLDQLHAYIALQQLAPLEASKQHEANLRERLLERLEAAERERFADPLDPLLGLFARTDLAARAAKLKQEWHSGRILTAGGSRFAMIRIDQSWLAIGLEEVTREAYAQFVEATKRVPANCRKPGVAGLFRSPDWQDPGFAQTGSHPVVCVSKADAEAYATWLSDQSERRFELPTAAAWHVAGKAAMANKAPCELGNVRDQTNAGSLRIKDRFECSDGFEFTAPVGQFQASRDGILDLIGNVSEWTQGGVRGSSYLSGPDNDLLDQSLEQDADRGRTDLGFRLALIPP
ncbi:hypothetical protein C7S18_14780 [Ahniella affigens]|uniref:Protein kinase domain-containing protein n=1 Tax=Ahniella affigens TaxID=2021234 RepID=A0A2P1PU51_9GAMM|nr:bifunctional serine/threonine-protein kinase/formylglycine-generating enzyme family protein [Ahniella affigens]AVP98373.1 hypothetical protein C7S18_14780 [Ahniella affigens]